MMLRLIYVLAIFGSIAAAPANKREVDIILYEFEPNVGDGSYKFSYEISDGQEREESGTVKIGQDNKEYLYVKGTYSYRKDDKIVMVKYEADEDGYRQTMEEYVRPHLVGIPASVIGSLIGGGLGK